MKTLEQKLLLFQQNVGTVKKDSKNPHFKNTYASLPQILSEVKPILSDLGLILLQPIVNNEVVTIIRDSESKDQVVGNISLPTGLTPQQMGSAITYFRRYLLAGMLSLEIDDDDANATNVKPTLSEGTEAFEKAKQFIKDGGTIADIEKKYTINYSTKQLLK